MKEWTFDCRLSSPRACWVLRSRSCGWFYGCWQYVCLVPECGNGDAALNGIVVGFGFSIVTSQRREPDLKSALGLGILADQLSSPPSAPLHLHDVGHSRVQPMAIDLLINTTSVKRERDALQGCEVGDNLTTVVSGL